MNDLNIIDRPEDVGMCRERLARIDTWRDKLVADGKLAGITTIVARRGHVAHWGMSGLADKERGKPIAADTIFRIYSMT
jgi:CubicO group peptidase (beta-lactamase class C family)